MLAETFLKSIGSPDIESFIILIERVDTTFWNVTEVLHCSRGLGLQTLKQFWHLVY